MAADTPDDFQLQIGPSQAGWRLDKVLAGQSALADISRSRLQALILAGHILVDGQRKKTGYRLKEGEQVTVAIPSPSASHLTPTAVDFAVLHEDGDILVINKPAGLVVHPAPGHAEHTLVHGLLHHCGDLSGIGGELRPGIVHRLDKDTSGVMIIAKNDAAHHHLAGQFQQRLVKKCYHGIVVGQPPKSNGRVETMIGRHPIQRKKMAVLRRNGRLAITNYRVVAATAELALLEIAIETGRTHQIRVHMSHLGCPLLADPIYGGKKTKVISAPRLCLHASCLQVSHPVSNEVMRFHAPLPDDMRQVLAGMGFPEVEL